MSQLMPLGVLALGFMGLMLLVLWLLTLEQDPRPLLHLYETVDLTALPTPEGMPAYIDPQTKDAA